MRYSWAEKFDIYNTYLENNRNATAALRHYGRKFPNRRQPTKLIFKEQKKNSLTQEILLIQIEMFKLQF